jgi:MFS family permease
MRHRLTQIYFGWWTVLALGIIGLMGAGFVTYGLSALFKPMAAELNLSRAATSVAAGVIGLGHLYQGPLAGWASDKYGPKWIILFGISCLTAGFILMNFIGSYWAFLVVWGLILGAGQAFACTIPPVKQIINWFVRKSALAISITFTIQLASGLILLPLVAWLTISYGWRTTCIVTGVTVAVIGFPLAWFLIKQHRPEHYGLLPDGDKKKETIIGTIGSFEKETKVVGSEEAVELTLRQALKTSGFWVMIATSYINTLVTPIMTVHLIPLLTDTGLSPVKAAGLMSIWLTAAAPARLITGIIVDRVKKGRLRYIYAISFFLQAFSFAAFMVNKSMPMVYVWLILYGFGAGANFSSLLPTMPRYFGRKAYGKIDGMRWMVMVPIGLVAPIYIGWIYDNTGSYLSLITLFAVLLAVAGVVACFMLPPKGVPKPTDQSV